MNIDMAVDKAWEGKSLREIAEAPVSALEGVSQADGEKLEAAFGVRTVRDLAGVKFFAWAQAIVALADMEMAPVAAESEGAEQEAGDDEAGDDEAGDDEAGDDEAGDDEAGDDEAGDDEAGDDEAGDDEAGDGEAGDDEAGDAPVVEPVEGDEATA
jgi:hypothetical protein